MELSKWDGGSTTVPCGVDNQYLQLARSNGAEWILEEVNLCNNILSGRIPLLECSELQAMWLSYNNFSGEISGGFGKLMALKELNVDDNNLISTILTLEFNQKYDECTYNLRIHLRIKCNALD